MGGELGENGYMYRHGWIPLLCTGNYHNIVNWLYSNVHKKFKEKREWWVSRYKEKAMAPHSSTLA